MEKINEKDRSAAADMAAAVEETQKADADIAYRFLDSDDRAMLRREGLSLQPDGNTEAERMAKEQGGVIVTCYAKAPQKIKKAKEERDSGGFFNPKPDPYRHDGKGLLCDILGYNPAHVIADMTQRLDYIAKESYEYCICDLMCEIRRDEAMLCRKIALSDWEAEKDSGAENSDAVGAKAKKPLGKKSRKSMLNGVIWKYDWIQYYKKDCYLFAQYMIEDKWKPIVPEHLLSSLSDEAKEKVLSLGEDFDSKKDKRGAALDKETRTAADGYWRLVRREKEKKAFCEKFVRDAAVMPEANRKLIDLMYEIAWDCIWENKYGLTRDQVPAPWYDDVIMTWRRKEESQQGVYFYPSQSADSDSLQSSGSDPSQSVGLDPSQQVCFDQEGDHSE